MRKLCLNYFLEQYTSLSRRMETDTSDQVVPDTDQKVKVQSQIFVSHGQVGRAPDARTKGVGFKLRRLKCCILAIQKKFLKQTFHKI
jgi:hypothetical protein